MRLRVFIAFTALALAVGWAALAAADPLAPGGSQDTLDVQGSGWVRGHTLMSDLTPEQKRARLGWRGDVKRPWAPRFTPDRDPATIPRKLDWRNIQGADYITPVRDQEDCGSCYAFSGVGAIEGNWAIQLQIDDPQLNLSEQYIVSCESILGCDGGLVSEVMSAAVDVGLPDEQCFDYTAWDQSCGAKCEDWATRTLGLQEYQVVLDHPAETQEDFDLMVQALQHGPLTVAFTVYEDFFDYEYGIYSPGPELEAGGHAVVIVGYDMDGEYWICKNSWGSGWGESGFFRIRWGTSEMGSETYLPVPMACTGGQLVVRGGNFGDNFLRYDLNAIPVVMRVTDDCGRGIGGAAVEATFNGKSFTMWDDGQHSDAAADDGIWTGSVPAGLVEWGEAQIAVTAAKDGMTLGGLTLNGQVKYPAEVLLIADDGGYPGAAFYQTLLDDYGVDYDLWDISGQRRAYPTELLPYAPAVLWFTASSLGTFDAAAEQAMRDYLDNGGQLLISGQDLLQNITVDHMPFVRDYLKVKQYWNDSQYDAVQGAAGEPLTKGLGGEFVFPFTNYDDVLKLTDDAKPIWLNERGKVAGLRYPATDQKDGEKLAFCAFPLEALPGDNAATFVARVMDWFFGGECLDTDGDGVGWGGACTGEMDCQNDDPAVYPGAPEICDDGKDNDCNGLTDHDDPACPEEPTDDDDNDAGDDDDDDDDDADDNAAPATNDDDDDDSGSCGC